MPEGRRLQLHRALSKKGLCSRKLAWIWIQDGRVRVNGRMVREPLQWVDLETDRIDVEAEAGPAAFTATAPARDKIYLLLHKPAGYVTTRADERGRQTVYDLLPAELRGTWLFPAGRLDKDSEGLLILTNDGVFADALTDPATHVPKTYLVDLDRRPPELALERMRQGVTLDGERLRPAAVSMKSDRRARVVLHEGKNRQIRRMFANAGCRVLRLVRVAVGPVALGALPAGRIRQLSPSELRQLKA